VVGWHLFNRVGISGVASLMAPMRVDPGLLGFDIWVMLGASLLLIPFVFLRRDLTKIWGIGLSAAYLGYVAVVLTA